VKTEESSAGEALPQHKHTNNLELETKEEKKQQNNVIIMLYYCLDVHT